uniref:ZAD domain-containing protein n=1 Tax=Lutzomyia longipalpis TaxID=7200 RepID=A0A1B0CGW7_LUTLO
MSRRRAISILESCRLCGLGGIESRRRHFLFGVDANEELLTILRSVLPIVIYPEDPLSKWICTKCREKVTRFYGISREYTKYFGKCLGALRKVDPEQTYLQICSDVETFAATLEDSLLEKVPTATFDRKRLILKDRGVRGPQKKERPPGEVPTLFEICIDYINNEGPKLLSTYLHVDTSGEWNESEVESSDSSMSYFEDDQQPVEESEYFDASTVECSVNITEEYTQEKNEYQSTPVAVAQNGIGKKRKLSRVSTDMEPIERPTRTKSRVNYSEDMIDEAFFYEQIMLEEYKRKAKSPKKEEPPQPVYKQRQVAAKGTHPRNSIASFPLNDIREQLKTDPTQVIQVNSELSIHLKAKEPRGYSLGCPRGK